MTSSPAYSHYDVLGIDRRATRKQIKTAFRDLAKRYHPDRKGSSDHFHAINEAYRVLSDPGERRAHDDDLATRRQLCPVCGSPSQAGNVCTNCLLFSHLRRSRKTQRPKSAYQLDQERLEREHGWQSDPANYEQMMAQSEADWPYNDIADDMSADEILQTILAGSAVRMSKKATQNIKVDIDLQAAVHLDDETREALLEASEHIKNANKLYKLIRKWLRNGDR